MGHVRYLLIPSRYWGLSVPLYRAPVYNKEYGLYSVLPEFQKAQINNPMVDVELKANTTKAENYRASGNIYGEVDFLKHFTFKKRCSLWTMLPTTDVLICLS